MIRIARKHSHFVFGVLQAGLTSFIAAGIASFPSPTSRAVPCSLAGVMADCMGYRAAGCCAGRSNNTNCVIITDTRIVESLPQQQRIRFPVATLRVGTPSYNRFMERKREPT